MKNRIYLTGGWGYGNKGDNAILMALLNSIAENIDSYKLTISSFSPKELKRMHSLDSVTSVHRYLTKSRKNPFYFFHKLAVAIWRATQNWSGGPVMISPGLNQHLKLIQESDVVLFGGGGYFNDTWIDALPSRLLEIEFATFFKKKVMFYAQSIGPFSKESCEQLLNNSFKGVDRITYRDKKSEQAIEWSGFNKAHAFLTADEVNLLPVLNPENLKNKDELVVGVMIQHLRKHEGPSGLSAGGWIQSKADYYDQVIKALAKINTLAKVKFVLIPSTTWDQSSCNRVAKGLEKSGITNFQLLHDPVINDFAMACQSVDVMISTNMHPIIIAATANKPSIAISYHYKLDDFMDSIGMAEFVTKIDDFTSEWIVEQFNKITSSYDAVVLRQSTLHAQVKDIAKKNINTLKDLINSNTKG